MLLVIDNYDSFTYNLVQYLGELRQDVRVVRNDEIPAAAIAELAPSHIVISPGPCTPNEAGISLDVIKAYAGKIPILGVCLGHQSIGQAFGGKIVRAARVMHGKTSMIQHDGKGVFTGLPNPFEATRYHSLVVLAETVPPLKPGQDGWKISAWTDEDDGNGGTRRVVMGLRRVWTDPKKSPVEGVQFHPESFLTEEGPKLLGNFLQMGPRPRRIQAGGARLAT